MSAKKYDFVPKSDVRQLIKVSKDHSRRINHPHARYNQLGRISCIVCGIQIKSEHAWNAHIVSKTHKQNESREIRTAPKRTAEHPTLPFVPLKKSNTEDTAVTVASTAAEIHPPEDRTASVAVTDRPSLGEKNPAEKTREDAYGSKLPEGFFDDRYKDAKARQVPYKDKVTEAIELFQREIVSLEKQSDDIMEKESEAMVSGRELEEIDTQMQKWERIKQLQTEIEILESKRREKETAWTTASGLDNKLGQVKEEPSDSDGDGADDVDELYNFRTKNIV